MNLLPSTSLVEYSTEREKLNACIKKSEQNVYNFIKLAPKLGNEEARVKHAEPIAKDLSLALKILQEIDVRASGHSLLNAAWGFRKLFSREALSSSRYLHRAYKHEFSTRLNIPYWITKLPENKDFFKWAIKVRLDAHLPIFGHKLTLFQGEIHFQTHNKSIPWSNVKEIALTSLEKAKGTQAAQIRFYDFWDGPTYIDTFDLSVIRPLRRISPPGQSYYEICVFAPELGLSRNHTWDRIVDGVTGDVYASSYYRIDGTGLSAKVVRGYGAVRTIDETFFNYLPTGTMKIGITPSEQQKLLSFRQGLAGKVLPFQNINHNCTTVALYNLNLLNITNLPKFKKSAWNAYAPANVVKVCLIIEKFLPRSMAMLCLAIINFIGVLIVYAYGGSKLSSTFKNDSVNPFTHEPVKPFLSMPKSLFDPEALNFTSPWFFQEIVLEELNRWREAKKAALEGADSAELAKIDYEIPPEWYGKSI